MSDAPKSNDQFEIVTTKNADGYKVQLMRNDRPSAFIFVDTETLAGMASTFRGSQDEALDFVAKLLVRTFCEGKETA
ncbi:hypothetical protein IPU75_01065 [Ochrobactrum sp. SD129]|nr:hypothetical protein [Ochrobactrum sp. SD129]